LFLSYFEMRAMERKYHKKMDHLIQIILTLKKKKDDKLEMETVPE
jgi:hypothetical protein